MAIPVFNRSVFVKSAVQSQKAKYLRGCWQEGNSRKWRAIAVCAEGVGLELTATVALTRTTKNS